jgi:hypothetical protein
VTLWLRLMPSFKQVSHALSFNVFLKMWLIRIHYTTILHSKYPYNKPIHYVFLCVSTSQNRSCYWREIVECLLMNTTLPLQLTNPPFLIWQGHCLMRQSLSVLIWQSHCSTNNHSPGLTVQPVSSSIDRQFPYPLLHISPGVSDWSIWPTAAYLQLLLQQFSYDTFAHERAMPTWQGLLGRIISSAQILMARQRPVG